MRKTWGIAVLLSLVTLTGCTSIHRTPFPAFSNLNVEEVETTEGGTIDLEEETLKLFFEHYFSLSEDEILLLNQNPIMIDEAYEKHYQAYKDKLLQLMDSNLTASAKEKLSAGYLTQDFHLPKKIALNGYVSFGPTKVEKVEIVATRMEGEHTFYKVALTTCNTVENLEVANQKYRWDTQKNYYVLDVNTTKGKDTFNGSEKIIDGIKDSYYYLQDQPTDTKDEIKLMQQYWVEVEPGNGLYIESIKEATPIKVNEEVRQGAMNTRHVERIPYYVEASASEDKRIRKIMEQLFSQKKEFFTYYDKKLETDYESFKAVWTQDMELEKEILIPKEDYRDAFNGAINPYKDDLKSLDMKSDEIMISPSLYSTKKQPRFIVAVYVKGIDNHNEPVSYIYKYYVGMELGRVECISFINREKIEEAS